MPGSTVKITIAEKVNCMTCGKECYSEFEHYICHNCWKDGSAAMHISQLQSMHNGRLEEIAALQDRIADLEIRLDTLSLQLVSK